MNESNNGAEYLPPAMCLLYILYICFFPFCFCFFLSFFLSFFLYIRFQKKNKEEEEEDKIRT